MGHRRRAIAKIRGKDGKIIKKKGSFLIKEGMLLGNDQSEVKAILPGGIVLVEKIKNVYNQVEYLETILPLISE